MENEDLILLNQQDFDNFEKIKNFNIFQCKHYFEGIE